MTLPEKVVHFQRFTILRMCAEVLGVPEIDPNIFTVIRRIGKGSFGEVLLVEDSGKQEFALKKMELTSKRQDEYLLREIENMMRMYHPCLLQLVGYSLPKADNRTATIVTPYMRNGSLFDILERERDVVSINGWDATAKTKVLMGIAAGLGYLHSIEIIHRDFKSDNIFMNEAFEPVIGDFGLSKSVKSKGKPNTEGIGTAIYMAPELSNGNYTQKIDVYAFAIVCYEVVTGLVPFDDIKDPVLILTKVREGHRPAIPDTVPQAYRELIEACWASDPNDRPMMYQVEEVLKRDDMQLPGSDPAAVAEYKTRIYGSSQSQEIQNLRQELASWQNYCKESVEGVYAIVDKHEESIKELEERVGKSDIRALLERMDKLEEANASQASLISAMNERICALERENKAKDSVIKSLERRMQEVENINKKLGELDQLERRIADIEADDRVVSLTEIVMGIKTTKDAELMNFDTRLSAVEELKPSQVGRDEIDSLRDVINKTSGRFDENAREMAPLKQSVSEVVNEMRSLKSALDSLQATVDGQDIDSVRHAVARMKDDAGSVEAIETIKTRLKEHRAALKEAGEVLEMLDNDTNDVRTALETHRTKTAERLRALEKRVFG